MNTIINTTKSLALAACILIGFAACNRDEIYKKEMYKKVVYLLSDNNQIYTEVYTLNEDEPVKYLSVGCGGSLPNEEEIVITLEADTVLLKKYNKTNFDIDSAAFAKLLPENHYQIPSMTVSMPAQSPDQYVKLPIKVRPEGLSPDTTYFVPLAIKSVSKYEINPEKYNVLYQVVIENDYAEQKTRTYYHMKGTSVNEGSTRETVIAGTKPIQPLTKSRSRVFAGGNLQTTTSSLNDILKNSIVLNVNSDRSISILPYSTIDVVQLYHPNYNKYSIEGKERYFYLYYRYRTLNRAATESAPAEWSAWTTVKETLRRLQ
ncbi:MAG: DUF1735 domain-containing protein [Prevotellaceae bacterium]|jgi:hypothetical protein|nr:DUF1735 domain-containing protein [Prevotellaceae bacterium]